jgi:hypothetical protein
MGKVNYRKKIYINLKQIICDYTYKELIYFIYNLGMDFYDGLNILSREDWLDIYNSLIENYTKYEVLKEIKYKEFRENIATVIEQKFYKHEKAYETMIEALRTFGEGNKNAKLKYLIKDFEEHEKLYKLFEEEDKD